jgi:hypothetical protein
MGHILKVKLKSLKDVIKGWNAETFGEGVSKRRGLSKRILDLDIKSEVAGLEEGEVLERKKLFDDLWRLLKNMDALTFQRSRSKWLKEGDENSRFFHNCIKARRRRNMLKALRMPRGGLKVRCLLGRRWLNSLKITLRLIVGIGLPLTRLIFRNSRIIWWKA